jgi:CRP/FNR family transcriptional regulator, cyclic AMP receptor protein
MGSFAGTPSSKTKALRSEPKSSELFMTYLLTRNSRVEEDLIDQLFDSSEATRATSSSARASRNGRQTSSYSSEYQPGNIGRNDPISREPLHEQIP